MNEKIIMLGTGSAMVTDCYNTCFTSEIRKRSVFLLTQVAETEFYPQLRNPE